MTFGGYGYSSGARVRTDDRVAQDRLLSDRHRKWGTECPAVDLDFVLCEFNHGVAVAVIDYYYGSDSAKAANTNRLTFAALSHLVDRRSGRWLPFVLARYWPDTWAFRVTPINDPAREWIGARTIDMTEQQYVRKLYALRKEVLTEGDRRTIARLNRLLPPDQAEPENSLFGPVA